MTVLATRTPTTPTTTHYPCPVCLSTTCNGWCELDDHAPAPTTATLAVLRQTLYALTRAVGDLTVGTLVAPLHEHHDPLDRPSCYVQDGAGRGAYVTPRDLERVTGLTVLADHVAGYTTAFGNLEGADHARRFATALMGASMPAVAGVWVGEVIRQH